MGALVEDAVCREENFVRYNMVRSVWAWCTYTMRASVEIGWVISFNE
jgi:hypothetical protein